jgi:diketogulonate reductase-like aldo/keto reductase
VAEFAAEHGIVVEGYSPLWRGRELLDEPVVVEAARAHGKTPGQVVLRWHVQLGAVPVPKSADPQRQAENLEVFDFALTDERWRRCRRWTGAPSWRPTPTRSGTDTPAPHAAGFPGLGPLRTHSAKR